MTVAEFAAFVGAAAWIPQIVSWQYRRAETPRVSIIASNLIELGYTRFGPIFNVTLAVAASRKDAIIDRLQVLLRHEDGESHTMLWQGLQETISEVTNLQGDPAVVQRQQPAIALKVPTVPLVDNFARFQESAFHDHRQEALARKELDGLLEYFRSACWLRPGRYTATFSIGSPVRVRLQLASYSFALTSQDVEILQGNVDNVREYFVDVLSGFEQSERTPKVIPWGWADAALEPIT